MAIGKSALLNSSHGKIGNLVLYEVGGELRIRSKGARYRDAKTAEQLAQRSRVKGIAALYGELSYQLLVYWKEQTIGTTLNGYNMFMRSNIHHIGSDGSLISPRSFLVTQGSLPQPSWVKAEITSRGTLKLAWDTDATDCKYATDQLRIVVYAPHRQETPRIWIAESADVERMAGTFEWSILHNIGGPLYFYGFFKSRFTNEISSGFYLGEIE